MLTSVRAKRFTGSSGKTSLDLSTMFFKDRLWKTLHEVAAGKLPLIPTSCIISVQVSALGLMFSRTKKLMARLLVGM